MSRRGSDNSPRLHSRDSMPSAVQIYVRFRPPARREKTSHAIHRINRDMVRVDGNENYGGGTPHGSPAKSVMRSVSKKARKKRQRGKTPSPSSSRLMLTSPSSRGGSPGSTRSVHGGLFKFHRVFGPQTSTREMYEETTSPMVDTLLKGYNCTIMAYGISGSGKTHTMMGPSDPSADHGIIPRVITSIFDKANARKSSGWSSSFSIATVQIYMEKVLDLLGDDEFDPDTAPSLHVRESGTGGKRSEIYVQGVTRKSVKSVDQCLKWIREGNLHRVTASTNMNSVSSRSHMLFMFRLEQANLDTAKHMVSNFYLVDLAGSETVARTGAEGLVLKQACHVNLSLTTLSSVISALSNRKSHVPYRDSKLTRILTHALGGNSQTAIILNCSPDAASVPETLATLQFGQRALDMPNKPQVNSVLTIADYERMLAAARKTVKSQRTVIEGLEEEVLRLNSLSHGTQSNVIATRHVVGIDRDADDCDRSDVSGSLAGDDRGRGRGEEHCDIPGGSGGGTGAGDDCERTKEECDESECSWRVSASSGTPVDGEGHSPPVPSRDLGLSTECKSPADSSILGEEHSPSHPVRFVSPDTLSTLTGPITRKLEEEREAAERSMSRKEYECEDLRDRVVELREALHHCNLKTHGKDGGREEGAVESSPAEAEGGVAGRHLPGSPGSTPVVLLVVGSITVLACLIAALVLRFKNNLPIHPAFWATWALAAGGGVCAGWGAGCT